ncbi:putative virion structural protein [Salmonella phage SPAsTU]|nr:hypothetical protein STsAS_101 [Salmonella phage STsAS]AWN08992.1 putative virion structural protein [Salmonella phage SPAsTU]
MAERYRPDLTLDAKSLVVALINNDNNLTLMPSELVITEVGVNENVEIIPRNTQALVAKARKPNGKQVVIYYDRLSASAILDTSQPLLISVEDAQQTTELLSVVNEYCGTNLTADDLVDSPITITDDVTLLYIDDASPAWLGTFAATLFGKLEYAAGVSDDDTVLCIGDDAVLTYGIEEDA